MIAIVPATNRRAVASLVAPGRTRDAATERAVRQIVDGVRRRGDRALLAYARRLDGLSAPIEVTSGEMGAAVRQVPPAVRRAIRQAARNIRSVARLQVPRGWRLRVAEGISVEQRVIPLDRVGCTCPADGIRFPRRC